jgi:hypothetical protein
VKYSQDEISEQIAKSKENAQQAMEQYDLSVTRDFTLEEEEKIRKGEMTVEEAMQLIMADSSDESGKADDTGANSTANSTENSANGIVSKYVAQVYNLKAYYIGQLGSLENTMRAEYDQSGKDKTKIAGIVKNYMPQVAAMESECDGKIASLLNDMRNELSAIGADTSIVDTINDSYVNEKSLRKSYYLSMY